MISRLSVALVLACLVPACATAPVKTDVDVHRQVNHDPLEPMNRQIFRANAAIDKALFRPVVIAYRDHMPQPARHAVTNVLDNASGPYVLLNDILQVKPGRAGVTLSRFLINTTFGLAGLMDPAEKWGLEQHDEDLGQTLAVWGVSDGPYLVLPLFGPSNLRDTAGLIGGTYADPVSIVVDETNFARIGGTDLSYFTVSRTVLDAFDYRVKIHEALEEIYGASDSYVFARSVYRQSRRFEITDGSIESTAEEEEMFENAEQDF